MEKNELRDSVELFRSETRELDSTGLLDYFMRRFPGRTALSSSLSFEDQAVTFMMASIDRKARIFTLDTGRVFPETYELIDRTCMTYGIKIEVFFPDYHKVQEMVREHGINLFYDSVELRHLCCDVRKIEPLKRALRDTDVWVTGIRRGQASTRASMERIEWDEADQVIKINPLIDWTEEQLREFITKNGIPYNKLHDKGFPSIGCQPCTRAVKEGEPIRAGRWWWEDPDHRECGLHVRG